MTAMRTRDWTPALVGAAPLIAMVAVRTLWPASGPGRALAHEPAPVALEGRVAPLEPFPPEVIAARLAAREALARGTPPSPFLIDHPVAPEAPTEPSSQSVPTIAETASRVDPDFVLSSIVAGQRGGATVAIINGKVRRAGETIAPGWSLESIDAASNTAVVRDAAGRTVTLSRSGPGAAR